jgi:hypothetical protein
MSPEPKDEVWVTRDGRRMLVGDMGENHVRNTLRMILRNRRKVREQFEKSGLASTRAQLALRLLGIRIAPRPNDVEADWETEFWNDMSEDKKWGDD